MPLHETELESKANSSPTHSSIHPTACLSCRAARQKCDRQEPCLECKYPSRSNRGRKRGSTNKPDTVEKLLSRINDSSVRDDVIAAIVRHHRGGNSSRDNGKSLSGGSDELDNDRSDGGPEAQESLYSPLQILAAAVAAEKDDAQSPRTLRSTSTRSNIGVLSSDAQNGSAWTPRSPLVDERLSKYFAPRLIDRTDWEVLSSQPEDSRFKVDVATCEPVGAGLIDHSDVALYFNLFYTVRNPFNGLLDPDFHTAQYVRMRSFTLFSVLCALGSAVSSRPRDKFLFPVLSALAEENIKWSIATSVKSIETIQAIINMTYWDSAHERLSDDPYWLRISHATQLARELGIHRPSITAQKLNALNLSSDVEKERLLRSYQRTWLYVFVVDKSFGMTTGRTISVSYKDIPSGIGDWWRRPQAAVLDRVITGCVLHRVIMSKAFEERRRLGGKRESVINWQREVWGQLTELMASRCAPDDHPSSAYLPILAFYIDHGMMAVNAVASRDLINIDGHESSDELAVMSQQTMDVAMRFLDCVVSNQLMVKLMLGLHNTQCLMISHAATEVMHAIKRSLSAEDALRAGYKIRLLTTHFETIAASLPSTSWPSLYLRLFKFFVAQLEELSVERETNAPMADPNNPFSDWWKFVDLDTFDFTNNVDMGAFMASDPQFMGTGWNLDI